MKSSPLRHLGEILALKRQGRTANFSPLKEILKESPNFFLDRV